jgi:hypothetical protein
MCPKAMVFSTPNKERVRHIYEIAKKVMCKSKYVTM